MLSKEKWMAYAQLMRLDKPVGSLLLGWNTLWGLWLAGHGQPPAYIVVIFLIGTFLTRSAGCVFNDLADRHFDGHVERTRARPLASGAVSAQEALALGIGLLVLSFLLVLLLNWQSILLSLFCAAITIIYPFCKRFLPTPQAMLGVCFASSILVAHTAILGKITAAGFFFFLAGAVWALVYDTYYALVDREDDLTLGLKSSAIYATGFELKFIALMSALMVIFLFIGALFAGLDGWFYLCLLMVVAILGYELWSCRTLNREKCFAAFHHNNWVGATVFLGIVLSYLG